MVRRFTPNSQRIRWIPAFAGGAVTNRAAFAGMTGTAGAAFAGGAVTNRAVGAAFAGSVVDLAGLTLEEVVRRN